MKHPILILLITFTAAWLTGCGPRKEEENLNGLSWPQVGQKARGTVVHLMMWQGDPYINAYMNTYVVPAVKKQLGVDLQIVPGQGTAIVSTLMAEKQAGKAESDLDLVWINGETFYQLRQLDALYGPFTDRLPNAKYIDFSNPFIGTDFGQPVNGYEAPWGNVQMCLIYDSVRTPQPPRTLAALETYVKAHPGTFTLGTDFTGMTLLKSFLTELAGGPGALAGKFDEEKYRRHSAQLWAYLNRVKPYFWKAGRTFPESVAQMHQLFVSGELHFTMSNNDGEVDNKILQGLFPPTARAYVLDAGTIQNSHYLGIAAQSAHKAGALAVVNFLLSPEAQLRKFNPQVWGDGTVLALPKLPPDWQAKFRTLPQRRYAPKREELDAKALPELAPEYMIRLYDDFRKSVVGA
jgi:putative spermidine/putrescine transport system substrate-binding protein